MTVRLGGLTGRTCAVIVAALLFTASVVPGTSHFQAPVDPAVASGATALVRVAHGGAGAVAAEARAAGASDVNTLDGIDVVTAQLTPAALQTLRSDPRVAFIAADTIVSEAGRDPHFEKDNVKPSPALAVLGADRAWTTATGRGVTVALMDSGIAEHPDLDGSVVLRRDFVNDAATQLDPGGHGTFMAGLIAAHGSTFKGVAPDAKLVSLRVLDASGKGKLHAVLAGFDWLLKNHRAYRIGVLNLSLGAPQATTYHKELMAGVVESAWFAGIAVIAAAGNGGPSKGSVAIPGADPFVVTVGSLADQGTPGSGDDRESVFSGRGPTKDGFTKPDVLAPGEHVASLRITGTWLDREAPEESGSHQSAPGYARLTGTSASTALVTGVAALVLQAHGSYSPTEVKGALVAAGRRVTGSNTPGADAARSLSVQPARVNTGLRPSLVLVKVLAENGSLAGGLVRWETVSWETVSWEAVTWESVTWESVTWEGVAWESVAWEGLP